MYEYKPCQFSTTHTNYIEEQGVFLYYKLHFQNDINYVFSQCIKLLGLDHSVTYVSFL
jgi:hypothetical protein